MLTRAGIFASGAAFAAIFGAATPAWAGFTTVPEPSTMGIFAIGAGAAYLLHRCLRKR